MPRAVLVLVWTSFRTVLVIYTKGIALPQLSEVNEIYLEPVTKRLRYDWIAADLLVSGHWVLFYACEARL